MDLVRVRTLSVEAGWGNLIERLPSKYGVRLLLSQLLDQDAENVMVRTSIGEYNFKSYPVQRRVAE